MVNPARLPVVRGLPLSTTTATSVPNTISRPLTAAGPIDEPGRVRPSFWTESRPPGCRKRNRSRKGPRGLSEKEGIGYNAETVAIMKTPEPPPYTHASLYVAGILADGAFV